MERASPPDPLPFDDARLADYRHVADPELLRRGEIFVAEGRLVVRTLLTASPLATRSVLVTAPAYESLRDILDARRGALPVYVVSQDTVERVTGYNIHRGCLAIGQRPAPGALGPLLAAHSETGALVVLEGIGNADNMGGVFRNAAAFGVDAVVVGPGCCDPLYRKAIRVSTGAALRVPFVPAGDWPQALASLKAAGFTVAALTPQAGAVPIDEFAARRSRGRRLAVVAGSESDGLSGAALSLADVRLRIPMAEAVDSLNVATATGIALHRLLAV